MTTLIQLADCKVTNISDENFLEGGCETCDYGSAYGAEYEFSFDDGTSVEFRFTEMYEQEISEGTMMKYILANIASFNSMTKEEFIANIKNINNILPYQDKEKLYSAW